MGVGEDGHEIAPSAIAAWERHAGHAVDPAELRATLTAGSLPEAFHRSATEAGGQQAIVIEGESATYSELDQYAGRAAAWLRSSGVDEGDRVVLCGPNSLAFVIAYLGTLRAGAIAVLAGADLTERELEHVVRSSGAAAAFAAGDARGRLGSIRGAAGLDPLVALEPGSGGPTLEEAIAGPGSRSAPQLDGTRTAVIGYTSGTTGAPKGAALSHVNVLASLRGVMIAWRWRPDDVLVHSLPMSHQHGLAGLQATLLAGSRAVIHRGLDPPRFAASVADEAATVMFSVPAVYERLLASSDVQRSDFTSLRLATSGSAPLPPELWRRAGELIGSEPLERWGTTESGLDVSNPYDGYRKPGSVGIPLPGIEIALVDDDGAPAPAGAEGEVVVRGPQVFRRYWRDDRATSDAFYRGGWFRTGDLGRVDPEDGYLSITGRLKELIISGGMNVYPREVELVVEEHPAVRRAAVVGVPSDRWGEAVVAFVVPAGDAVDPDEVRDHAREMLAPYKVPKAVLATDELPFDRFGKLRRAALIEIAKEELE